MSVETITGQTRDQTGQDKEKTKEKLTELKLTPQIGIEHDGSGDKFQEVAIGNSGLVFHPSERDGDVYYMHYMPEGYSGSRKREKVIKYSVIFGAAFYEFMKWWLNEENFEDIPRPQLIKGTTNRTMHEFQKKLFNRECVEDGQDEVPYQTLESYGDEFSCQINLKALANNQTALGKLKRLWDRANRGDIKIKDQLT